MAFYFEIVTPEEKIYQGQVKKIVIPSSTGQLTILPHHTPLFTPLNEGIVKVVDEHDKLLEFPIGKGMIEVSRTKVEILLEPPEHSEKAATNKAEAAEQRAVNLNQNKAKATGDIPIREAFRRSLLDLKGIKIKRRPRTLGPSTVNQS